MKKRTIFLTTLFILFFISLSVNAATVTWNGGGVDNLASNPANWSGSAVPQYGDDVIFDSTSTKDCTWDIEAILASLIINSGYTGRVTLSPSINLAIEKNFVLPNAPTGLNAAAISSSQIDLSWTDNSDKEAGFKIERKTGIGGTYSEIATVLADITTYSDTGLTAGTTYYYQVRAYNAFGDSAYSNEANTTTLTAPPTTITDPATNVTHDSARLNATVNPNGSETTVYFELGTDTNYGLFTSTPISIDSGTNNVIVWVDVIGFSPETTYHYRVVATNVGGTSYGNDISFTTTGVTPTGTIEVKATINGVDWSGSVNYTLSGPENINGTSTPATYSGKPIGDYTLTYNSGGPDNAVLNSITPSATQTLSEGATITFTLNFIYSPPTAITFPASNVNGSSATLNAIVNPRGAETTVYFEWGTTTSYGNNTYIQSIGSGMDDISVSANITGLSINTTYHYRVVAANAYGTSYGDDVSFTTPPITITITAPLDSSTINRPDVMVKGTIANATGNETGITVNLPTGQAGGIVAITYGNQFIANHVPLTEGQNTITIIATDTAGFTAITSITVNANTTGNYIKLTANIESGISPLETTLNIDGTFSITNSNINVSGPGSIEWLSTSIDEYIVRMTVEGIYYFTASVTGPNSIVYQDTVAIVVLNAAELDALLQAKWNAMKTALRAGDIETSLNYLYAEKRETHRAKFEALIGTMPAILDTFVEFNFVKFYKNTIEYEIVANENGIRYSYPITFIKDTDGIWRFKKF